MTITIVGIIAFELYMAKITDVDTVMRRLINVIYETQVHGKLTGQDGSSMSHVEFTTKVMAESELDCYGPDDIQNFNIGEYSEMVDDLYNFIITEYVEQTEDISDTASAIDAMFGHVSD